MCCWCEMPLFTPSQAEPHPQLRAADALLQSAFQQSQGRPRFVHLWDPATLSLELCRDMSDKLPHDTLFRQSKAKKIQKVDRFHRLIWEKQGRNGTSKTLLRALSPMFSRESGQELNPVFQNVSHLVIEFIEVVNVSQKLSSFHKTPGGREPLLWNGWLSLQFLTNWPFGFALRTKATSLGPRHLQASRMALGERMVLVGFTTACHKYQYSYAGGVHHWAGQRKLVVEKIIQRSNMSFVQLRKHRKLFRLLNIPNCWLLALRRESQTACLPVCHFGPKARIMNETMKSSLWVANCSTADLFGEWQGLSRLAFVKQKEQLHSLVPNQVLTMHAPPIDGYLHNHGRPIHQRSKLQSPSSQPQ